MEIIIGLFILFLFESGEGLNDVLEDSVKEGNWLNLEGAISIISCSSSNEIK